MHSVISNADVPLWGNFFVYLLINLKSNTDFDFQKASFVSFSKYSLSNTDFLYWVFIEIVIRVGGNVCTWVGHVHMYVMMCHYSSGFNLYYHAPPLPPLPAHPLDMLHSMWGGFHTRAKCEIWMIIQIMDRFQFYNFAQWKIIHVLQFFLYIFFTLDNHSIF